MYLESYQNKYQPNSYHKNGRYEDQRDNYYQYMKLTINPETSSHQLLHVRLMPQASVYIGGEILYSNINYIGYLRSNRGYKKFHDKIYAWYAGDKYPLRKFTNNYNIVGIIAIRRKDNGGRILVLYYLAYGENLFVNGYCLILSNVTYSNGEIVQHPVMKHMVKRILFKKEEEEKNGMTINAVQALPYCSIMEKSLGFGEKIFVSDYKSIMAISESIKAKKMKLSDRQPNLIELYGPGWVFVDTLGRPSHSPQIFLQLVKYIIWIFILSVLIQTLHMLEVYLF